MVQIWETVFSVPVPVPVPDFRVRSKKCVTLNLPFLNRPENPYQSYHYGHKKFSCFYAHNMFIMIVCVREDSNDSKMSIFFTENREVLIITELDLK